MSAIELEQLSGARITRILMRCSPELLVEVVKGRDLSLVDLAPSAGEVEQGGAVNL